MKVTWLFKVLICLCLLLVQIEAGCFSWRRRKTKSNILRAALAAVFDAHRQEPAGNSEDLQQGPPVSSPTEVVERSVETDDCTGGDGDCEEGTPRHAALRLLSRVLSDLLERPQPSRQDIFDFRVTIEWTTAPVLDYDMKSRRQNQQLGALLLIALSPYLATYNGE
ncbi:unnamed protein product [Mesocestoides corti]|uniref:Uncharacterized protein n=1 Tax=Mesocestoides corti TaxID=53468 RepID=A0A0R3UNL2_MESCO|nr:unnamed protein product [Mesocestoides corti]